VKKILWCLLLALGLLSWAALNTDFFNVQGVYVEGDGSLTDTEIIALSGVQATDNIFTLDPHTVSRSVMQNTRVKNVEVHRDFVGRSVTLSYELRKPVMLLSREGTYALVDEEGVVISLSDSFSVSGVLFLTGVDIDVLEAGQPVKTSNEKLFQKAAQCAAAAGKSGVTAFVSELSVADGRLTLYADDGIRILLGEGKNLESKMDMLFSVLQNLRQNGKTGGIVDMRYEGYPTYSEPVIQDPDEVVTDENGEPIQGEEVFEENTTGEPVTPDLPETSPEKPVKLPTSRAEAEAM